MYSLAKTIHIASALLSISGFFARAALLLGGSDFPRRRGVRRFSYVIDSVLLGSAIVLMTVSSQYPFQTPWLTAKVFGVIAYIGLGILTFRLSSMRGLAAALGVLCLLAAGYIASVAISKNPHGFTVWMPS